MSTGADRPLFVPELTPEQSGATAPSGARSAPYPSPNGLGTKLAVLMRQ